MTNISLKDLIESGAHFGHQSRRWNPKMGEFIHSNQNGIHIFDLIKTKELFEEALAELTKAAKEGKTILLLATKKQARAKAVEIAKEAGIFYVDERWLGGTLTNFEQIKKSIRKLKEMKEKLANGDYKDRTKKERLLIEREIARLTRFFGGIKDMQKTPEVIIIVDIKREFGAVREAKLAGVKTIGIVDTNADPTLVTHPIPMNDDATRALEYAFELIKDAILAGKGKLNSSKEKLEKKTKTKKEKKNNKSPEKSKTTSKKETKK